MHMHKREEALTLRELIRSDLARFHALAAPDNDAGQPRAWRAFLHPRIAPVAWYRVAHRLHARGYRRLGAIVSLFVQMTFRVEIPARANIGPGLVLPHPMGIVIGSAQIGANVTIYQNVTLGARHFDGGYTLALRPVIQDGATIGSGAVVLGPIVIGQGATVAANSLLLQDAPPNSLALGVPAQIKPRTAATET